MIRGSSGISISRASNIALEKIWASFPNQLSSRKAMSSPPATTIGSTGTISSPRFWPVVSRSTGTPDISIINNGFVSFCKTGDLSTLTSYVYSNNVTYDFTPSYLRSTLGASFYFDGSEIEFVVYNGNHSVKIDDEYISLTPQAASGAQRYYIPLGSRKIRRFDYIMDDGAYFGGCYTGANDTITPADIRGPKTVVMGDSFFATTVTGRTINGIPVIMGDMLGWDDVISTGSGGTGLLAKGSKTTFRERVQHDVIDLNPDVVVICGSTNDATGGYSKAAILSEARLLFAEIKSNLPDVILFATSPTWHGGACTFTSLLIDHRDAIKQAVEEYGGMFIDWLELPLGKNEVAISGTINANITAGASSFGSATYLGNRNTVKIGTDRVLIKSSTGASPGPYTYTIDGTFLNAHTSGDVVTTIGGSLLSGTGQVGSTTGYGNCDLWIGADGVHPTIDGNNGFARFKAEQIVSILRSVN